MPSTPSKPLPISERSDWADLTHRADLYARCVCGDLSAGDRIVAGPMVLQACERHLRDRLSSPGYVFDEARADHAIAFFETVLKLPDLVDEDGDPLPFLLQPWQAFIIGSLFGWLKTNGYRRFREAYIEIGKGNGKTPMCAGVGLYGLFMDGERSAEIYAAASDQSQAQTLFRYAVNMVKVSPDLDQELRLSGGYEIWKIEHAPSLSFFRTFSRESGAKSGPIPHMGLLDELHEHGTPQISIKIRAGAKRRKNALFLEITNSGYDRTTICWEHHEHSRKVLEGRVQDDQWFAFVCGLADGNEPLEDESCWLKANPNLGVSITEDYLKRQVSNAKNIMAETNTVLRLNFCVWTQAHTLAIDMGKWDRCQPLPNASELLGLPCFGGLDLGQSDDFSAWVRIWILADGRVAVKSRFWIPQAALEKYPNRAYAQWQRAGILNVTESNTTDYDQVQRAVLEDCRRDGVREVAYDKRFAEQMAQNLLGAGIVMTDQPQGEWLHEAIQRKLELIENGLLCHGQNEILSWMATNYVIRKPNERMRPDKMKAGDKIDGQVALDMALQVWVDQPVKPPPQYQFMIVGAKR